MKVSWISSFSFGDMNNAPKRLVKFQSHYYLKDLKHVYYAYHGKDYGKEDQTMLIDDEFNKVL